MGEQSELWEEAKAGTQACEFPTNIHPYVRKHDFLFLKKKRKKYIYWQ